MSAGDSIGIKYLDHASIITGLKPFSFPTNIFLWIMALPFTIGLISLGVCYIKVNNEIKIYRYGKVAEAALISMIPTAGLLISGIGGGITVHYQYKTSEGQTILGESFTNDFSILNTKKQGDLLKILVSADNESKSLLISKLDEIQNNWKIG